jgi:cysteine desulfurase/selenocysteine lyase
MDTSIDVDAVRADTPGCAEVVHFNNAGAALPPDPALHPVIDHLRLEARIGGYEAAWSATDRLTAAYGSIARLIGARPDEIAMTENATRAWDLAFYGIPLRSGDRILTSRSEYASNAIAFLHRAHWNDVRVQVIPDDEAGQVSVKALADMLADDQKATTTVIAINHVPTHDGLINPAAEVGALAREAGALYLLDACQSIGQLRVDVDEIGCDMLSATGRKFLRGPRGTGFLYVRSAALGRLEPPFLDLDSAVLTGPDSYEMREGARRFETWERFVAGQLGLGAAVDYALDLGIDAIEARVIGLADRLRAVLADIPGVSVHDRGSRRCGIVTFTQAGRPAAEIQRALRAERINVSVTDTEQYRFDAAPGEPRPRVRASVHYYNTVTEIDRLATVLAATREDTH